MFESYIRVRATELDTRVMGRRTLLKQEIKREIGVSATMRERRNQQMQRLESLRRLIDHCTDGYVFLTTSDNDAICL